MDEIDLTESQISAKGNKTSSFIYIRSFASATLIILFWFLFLLIGSDQNSITDRYLSDVIQVQVLAEKKGTFLKHTEFRVRTNISCFVSDI
jgi:hypothetical protein